MCETKIKELRIVVVTEHEGDEFTHSMVIPVDPEKAGDKTACAVQPSGRKTALNMWCSDPRKYLKQIRRSIHKWMEARIPE